MWVVERKALPRPLRVSREAWYLRGMQEEESSGRVEVRAAGGPSYTLLTWVLLAAAAALAALFAYPAVLGRLFVEDDLAAYHLPFRAFYHAALHEGHGFLWIPHIFNGFYLHGDGQIGMLHPWHLLLYRALPLQPAFMIELLGNYALLGLGMFVLLRRWRLPAYGAIFGGVLVTFLGFHINHYIDMAFMGVLAHLPWSLYVIDRILDRDARRRTRWLVALALLGGSQLLLGFPQGVYYAWVVEGLYALWLAVDRRLWKPLAELLVVKALAAGIGLAQLLPTYDVMDASVRAVPGLEMQGSVSLHPYNFFSLFSPYLFQRRLFGPIKGDEPWDAVYMGALTVCLLFLVLARWRHLGRYRVLTAFAFTLVVFGAASALGKYGPLIHVYAELPLVNKFRAHARHLCIAHTGLALLAAIGFSHLAQAARARETLSTRHLAWVALAPAVSLLIALGVLLGRSRWSPWQNTFTHFTMAPAPLLFGTALVVLAAVLIVLAGRGHRWALVALAALLVADAGLYSLRHKMQQSLEEFRATVDVPDVAPGTRLDPDIHPMTLNRLFFAGMRGVYGYTSFMPARTLDYTQLAPLRLAGVQYRQARVTAGGDLREAAVRGENWVPFTPGVPYAWRVGRAEVSTDVARELPDIDPAEVVLLERPIEEDIAPGGYAVEATALDPGELQWTTRGEAQQMFAVSESYHPGWEARVDGTSVPVQRAYGDFMGCVVPPGEHTVAFSFRPTSFRVGLAGTLCALVALALYAVVRTWITARCPSPRP